jgi:outer membrane protein assembly factor BamB
MKASWNAFVAIGSLLALIAGSATAGDWPQWRGPERDGRADPADLPNQWPDELQPAWRLAIGEGHSSPIVADGRVYAFSRQDGREIARAIDLGTGDVLWSASYDAPYMVHNAARDHGAGPKSTPIIAGGRLFTFGISGILSCFDVADGSVVWRKEFSERFEKTSPLYGTAASPLITNGKVIAHVGGHDDGALIAVSVADGREVWTWDGDGPGYTSPILIEAGGARQLVTQSQTALIGLDPETGRLRWRVPLRTPYDQNSITPLVHEGLLIYGGFQKPTVAARLVRQGDDWQLVEVWKNGDIPVYMSTPVISGDLLFGFTHRNSGQLFCADASTGEVHWTGTGRAGDNAALIGAGDVILAQFTTGELHVLKATSESPEVVARYRVADSATWAHPAIAAGRLLTKDVETLTCWTLK